MVHIIFVLQLFFVKRLNISFYFVTLQIIYIILSLSIFPTTVLNKFCIFRFFRLFSSSPWFCWCRLKHSSCHIEWAFARFLSMQKIEEKKNTTTTTTTTTSTICRVWASMIMLHWLWRKWIPIREALIATQCPKALIFTKDAFTLQTQTKK